jgi:hypothetical protein
MGSDCYLVSLGGAPIIVERCCISSCLLFKLCDTAQKAAITPATPTTTAAAAATKPVSLGNAAPAVDELADEAVPLVLVLELELRPLLLPVEEAELVPVPLALPFVSVCVTADVTVPLTP